MGIKDYSTNPDNNGTVAGVPYFPPGMYANALEPALRQVMADIAAAIGGGNAVAADIFAGTKVNAYITPKALFDAVAPVALADGNTVTPASGFNFTLTLGALTTGTRTLANPTGFLPGQSGIISLKQDATGNRLIASYGSAYDFGSAGTPLLSTLGSRADKISYYVDSISPLHLTCTFAYGYTG